MADAEKMKAAIEDVIPHIGAWTALLEARVESMEASGPDGEGDADLTHAQHELRAMKRDLATLAQSVR